MLISKTWRELVRRVGDNEITEDQLKAFLDDPNAVLRNDAWTEELLYQAPKGTMIEEVHFLGGQWLQHLKRGEQYFVRYNGEERGPYSGAGAGGFRWVDGKLFYTAEIDDQHWIIWGDEKIGPEECFMDIEFDENGKMLYSAERQHSLHVVVWDGEVIERSPKEIQGLCYCRNRPLYAVHREDGYHVIWHGLADYGPFPGMIRSLQDGGGNPLFWAPASEGGYIVRYAESQYGPFWDGVNDFQYTEDDQIMFWTLESGVVKLYSQEYLYLGQRFPLELKQAPRCLQVADGKKLYFTYDEAGPCIYWDTQRIGVKGVVKTLRAVDGKLLYWESRRDPDGPSNDFIVYDGQEHTRPSVLHDPQVVKGMLLSVSTHRDRDWVVWGSSPSRRYDEVYSLGADETHIYFAGRIGPRLFLVSRQI